jgi:hypothetical protein
VARRPAPLPTDQSTDKSTDRSTDRTVPSGRLTAARVRRATAGPEGWCAGPAAPFLSQVRRVVLQNTNVAAAMPISVAYSTASIWVGQKARRMISPRMYTMPSIVLENGVAAARSV